MGQQKDYTFKKDVFKGTLRLSSLTILILCGLNGTKVLGDNTFVINFVLPAENASVELGTDKAGVKGAHVVEKTVTITHPKETNIKEVNLVQPQAQVQPQVQPQPQPQAEALKPIKPKSLLKTSVSNAAVNPAPKVASSEKQKSLQLVQPRPKAVPIADKDQASAKPNEQSAPTPQKAIVSYSDAANDRSPLGLLDPAKEVRSQRWYLYSSAVRGLKDSPEGVHIVSMEAKEPKRGEEVKNLLVEMGIEPKKIKLIHAQGEGNQAGVVYIFAGK